MAVTTRVRIGLTAWLLVVLEGASTLWVPV